MMLINTLYVSANATSSLFHKKFNECNFSLFKFLIKKPYGKMNINKDY